MSALYCVGSAQNPVVIDDGSSIATTIDLTAEEQNLDGFELDIMSNFWGEVLAEEQPIVYHDGTSGVVRDMYTSTLEAGVHSTNFSSNRDLNGARANFCEDMHDCIRMLTDRERPTVPGSMAVDGVRIWFQRAPDGASYCRVEFDANFDDEE